jgi:ectoine hydroxylase-related dioxygenase (phytanoyl-CoA dioxygenase family)
MTINNHNERVPMNSDLDSLVTNYEKQGVIRVRELFDALMMAQIRQQLDRYIQEKVASLPQGDFTFEADGQTVRNLWRMEKHDPFFLELAHSPKLLTLIERLVNGKPELYAVETFNKRAKVGSGVPPHQDNAYFCRTPPEMLTVWLAIDPVTVQNGAVCYITGSHRLGMLPHKPSGVAGNSVGLDVPFDASDPFVGTLNAGYALIHHCQTIHYSEPNRTDHSRCGLLMVFRGTHTRIDPTLRDQYTYKDAVK